ncbi:MAG: tRNA dihydrouridine synthase DusB [Deltaproteobacteria bacterium]|nr:tRNA dihydrouridine synthase DusB [Deltaproteobacteria bacterium]
MTLTKLKIRGLDLGTGVCVSPMVGVTDLPFRRLCREFGADITYTEMVAGPALAAAKAGKFDVKTLRILKTERDEFPYAIQLFGSMPDALAVGAKVAVELGANLVDFNMGCPTRRVAGSGSGSGLLREPELARRCIGAIRKAAPDVPVTVKIRAGWDVDHVNGPEICRIAEDEGADAVTVHGRFRSQSYGDAPDWNHITNAIDAVSIPIIGNGGILRADQAVAMARQTGCAGVMLARGVLGNPWLVREVKAALEGRAAPPAPTAMEKRDIFFRFWREMSEFRGFQKAIKDIRKHLIWISKGLRGANDLRRDVALLNSEEALLSRAGEFSSAPTNTRSAARRRRKPFN